MRGKKTPVVEIYFTKSGYRNESQRKKKIKENGKCLIGELAQKIFQGYNFYCIVNSELNLLY